MQQLGRILRSLFSNQQQNNRALDSFELRKEEFYANYPANQVDLPCEGASGSNFDESLNTQENAKAGHILSFYDRKENRVNKSQNNEEAKDDVVSLDKGHGGPDIQMASTSS